jgi:hypothetical protein
MDYPKVGGNGIGKSGNVKVSSKQFASTANGLNQISYGMRKRHR